MDPAAADHSTLSGTIPCHSSTGAKKKHCIEDLKNGNKRGCFTAFPWKEEHGKTHNEGREALEHDCRKG